MLVVIVCLCCALGALWFAGCTTPADNNAASEGTIGPEGSLASEQVTGTITSLNGSELLIEITESSVDYLQGPARIDTSQIEGDLAKNLKPGDKIKLEFSGIVGMSEPPYISATKLEVLK
ncbi:MAG: YobA family protein [Coriobacteriales bacterium]|nr:YobA family protein [Coriobacteriales bacterium]